MTLADAAPTRPARYDKTGHPGNGRPALVIRDMPTSERPRERLRDRGADHLSNAELLAILLRTGVEGENAVSVATRVLARFNGLEGLARASYAELCGEKGLSHAKSCQFLAAFELGKRVASLAPGNRARVGRPEDVANLLMAEMSLLEREHLKVVLLNTKNEVLGVQSVYVGSVNSALVRPAEVFSEAVRRTCPSVVVAHNHPSGDPTPSSEDVSMTTRLVKAGRLLDIDVVDHVVIGRGRYVSLRERGLGFE